MNATVPYLAEQIARENTRDRMRDAEQRRAARAARAAAHERRHVGALAEPVAPVRRRRIFPVRTTT